MVLCENAHSDSHSSAACANARTIAVEVFYLFCMHFLSVLGDSHGFFMSGKHVIYYSHYS